MISYIEEIIMSVYCKYAIESI